MVMFHSCLYVYQRVSNKKTGISHSLAMFFPHEMRNSATSKSDTASKIWATMENEPTEIVINQIAHAITIMSKITCWKRFMLNGIKHSWIHCTGFPRWIRVPRDTKVKTPSAIPTWERTVLSPHCSYGWRGYSNVWDPKCVQYPWLQKKEVSLLPGQNIERFGDPWLFCWLTHIQNPSWPKHRDHMTLTKALSPRHNPSWAGACHVRKAPINSNVYSRSILE